MHSQYCFGLTTACYPPPQNGKTNRRKISWGHININLNTPSYQYRDSHYNGNTWKSPLYIETGPWYYTWPWWKNNAYFDLYHLVNIFRILLSCGFLLLLSGAPQQQVYHQTDFYKCGSLPWLPSPTFLHHIVTVKHYDVITLKRFDIALPIPLPMGQ